MIKNIFLIRKWKERENFYVKSTCVLIVSSLVYCIEDFHKECSRELRDIIILFIEQQM